MTPRQQLEAQAQQQYQQGDLIGLTRTLTHLAPLVPVDDRQALAVALHDLWQRARPEQIAQGWQTAEPTVAQWALYAERLQAGDPQPVASTMQLYTPAEAPLLSLLNRPHPTSPQTIAILLPLSGPYAQVGREVRNGLIRAALSKDSPTVTLHFYDTHETDPGEVYSAARDAGADLIIGPLLPRTIAAVSEIAQLPALLLNRPTSGYGDAFPFQTLGEAAQLSARLQSDGIMRVGVLHENRGRSQTLVQAFSQLWLSDPAHRLDARPLQQNNRALRTTLDQLLHVDRSKARRWTLQQRLGHKLTFTPRARRDLQGLVLLTDPKRAAVLNPLMSFYDIDIPRYGSSLLMPAEFSAATQTDLAGVRFPAFPALLQPNGLASPLEAWGWDALHVAVHMAREHACLNGQTGHISLSGRQHDRRLKWLQYSPKGQLTEDHP